MTGNVGVWRKPSRSVAVGIEGRRPCTCRLVANCAVLSSTRFSGE